MSPVSSTLSLNCHVLARPLPSRLLPSWSFLLRVFPFRAPHARPSCEHDCHWIPRGPVSIHSPTKRSINESISLYTPLPREDCTRRVSARSLRTGIKPAPVCRVSAPARVLWATVAIFLPVTAPAAVRPRADCLKRANPARWTCMCTAGSRPAFRR